MFYFILISLAAPICTVLAQTPCVVTSYYQVNNAVKNCMYISIKGITVPQGQTLTLHLKPKATVIFSGTITFAHYNWDGPLVHISGRNVYLIAKPDSKFDGMGITVPQNQALTLHLKPYTIVIFYGTITFAHYNWDGPLVHISGSNVFLMGAPNSKFDGLGASYWDGLGDNGVKKPTFFKIETSEMSTLYKFNIINCPKQCVAIAAHHTVLNKFSITNFSEDPRLPKNTDGFDLAGASFVRIEHSVVRNQDDCVAVNQGNELIFKNLTCYGGHGLSLSVGFSPLKGLPNIVHNVHFVDCAVIDSRNGIHIKTHADAGIGFVANVTYKNIGLSGIEYYGINIQQDYVKGNSTGSPNNNIPITHLLFQNIIGSMAGQPESMPVYILSTGCEDWNWLNVSIKNGIKPDACTCNPRGFTCS